MKFSEIVANNFPARAIRIRVGDTEIYMGTKSRGLDEMSASQIDWLNSHNCIHCWRSSNEMEIVYRKNKAFEKLVWGK